MCIGCHNEIAVNVKGGNIAMNKRLGSDFFLKKKSMYYISSCILWAIEEAAAA